jgi:hypothetical protein
MLESNGFRRYGKDSLFEKPESEEMDINSYKFKSQLNLQENSNFKGAKYSMITGDKIMNPQNIIDEEISAATNINNINGESIKVILLSMAGSEGIDFKFIRQIHILEPWYNINRIEQIIGRGVRNCSHSKLELKERNVKIYMHGTLLNLSNNEALDLMVYRRAEKKAKQIGIITRLLKEISIDCYLNEELLNYDSTNLSKILNNGLNIVLSNNENINYFIGDKANSALCDYMESCEYKCSNYNNKDQLNAQENSITYNETFLELNNDKIIQLIEEAFKEKFFYEKLELINIINLNNTYSLLAIHNALTELINNDNIFIKDKYDRMGKLINIANLYIFQPRELNNNNFSNYNNSSLINYKTDNLKYLVQKNIKEPSGFKKIIIKNPDAEKDDSTIIKDKDEDKDEDKTKVQFDKPLYTHREKKNR